MFRKLTLSIALATACAVGNHAVAQTSNTAAASPKVELASYAQDYSSCQSCSQGGAVSGGPATGAYGAVWGGASRDCSRFQHYPYVFYPQNFKSNDYYRSSDSMYYRYPPEMQIPVYNKGWHNYYPSPRRYHWGHQFILDVF